MKKPTSSDYPIVKQKRYTSRNHDLCMSTAIPYDKSEDLTPCLSRWPEPNTGQGEYTFKTKKAK